MSQYKLFFICLTLIGLIYPFGGITATQKLELNTTISQLPLADDEGYILVNLTVNGTAPSIEITKTNGNVNLPLKKEEVIKLTSKKYSVSLKDVPYGTYLAKLPQGVYQISKINVPYFNLPYVLDTELSEEWRFTVAPGKTSYIGNLVIDKQRSTKSVAVSLFNHLARDYESIFKQFNQLLLSYPLRSGQWQRDDFLIDYIDDLAQPLGAE